MVVEGSLQGTSCIGKTFGSMNDEASILVLAFQGRGLFSWTWK
jgi:hypothetical protein